MDNINVKQNKMDMLTKIEKQVLKNILETTYNKDPWAKSVPVIKNIYYKLKLEHEYN